MTNEITKSVPKVTVPEVDKPKVLVALVGEAKAQLDTLNAEFQKVIELAYAASAVPPIYAIKAFKEFNKAYRASVKARKGNSISRKKSKLETRLKKIQDEIDNLVKK